MESIHVITISKCSYCKNLINLLKKFKIKYFEEKIPENKKQNYKTKAISTFPQVYYIDPKSNKVLLGGFTETVKILDHIADEKEIEKLPINTKKKNKIRIYKFFLSLLLKKN